MEAIYSTSNSPSTYFCNVEDLAEKNGLILEHYGDLTDIQHHNMDSYLSYALFTNQHNKHRKKQKSIEVFYYMNRVGKKDRWLAGKVYSLEVEGLKTNNNKPWGGLFPDIPCF